MVLKKNYSLNNRIKHNQYVQFKNKRFPFTLQIIAKKQVLKTAPFSTRRFFLKKGGTLFLYLFSKMTNCLRPLPLNQNRSLFLDNTKYLKHKQIQTKFQSIVKDQKKRAAFAQNELKKVTLKALLTTTHKMLNNPIKRTRNKYQKQHFNSGYPKFGPILFLDETINALFTEKTKSFSRVRNRCILTGQRTIIGRFRLGRICFRHYAGSGQIPGLIKNKN